MGSVILNMPQPASHRARVVPTPSQVVVTPRNINDPCYHVTQRHAEQMVARGRAVWIPGLKRLREVQPLAVRGESREWRPTMCYDPDTRVAIKTMQLVVPKRGSNHITRQSKTRTNSKRRPTNRVTYQM